MFTKCFKIKLHIYSTYSDFKMITEVRKSFIAIQRMCFSVFL